jgi:hypothetical protein
MANIPPEILFSAWAFVWTIVYYIVSNAHLAIPLDLWDPTVAISVALSFQLLGLLVIVFRAKLEKIPSIFTKFILLTAFFKAGPLWLVYSENRSRVSEVDYWNPATFDLVKSTVSFGVAFLVYLAYLYYRKLNLFAIYDDFLDSLVEDDNRIPPYYWIAGFAKSI